MDGGPPVDGSLIRLYSTSTPVPLHVVMFNKLAKTDLHIICEMFTARMYVIELIESFPLQAKCGHGWT